MKFLCMAYEEEGKLNQLSKSEWHALRQETLDYVESMRRNGQLIITTCPTECDYRVDRQHSERQTLSH